MAGKAAAENGVCYDATPFTYTEDDDPITYFGECLSKCKNFTFAVICVLRKLIFQVASML